MKPTFRGCGALGLVLAALLFAQPRGWSQEPPPLPTMDATANDAVQVQTRGPIHEAYAQPFNQTPQPGPVVPKQPPDPIAEVPPDQKPEGENIQWIPGYWAWDNNRNDFLWVSGFWRNVPPGRQWVPGHWQQVEGGWQWEPGLWAPAGQADLPYLPEPPASLDYGPTTPAPDDNSIYVPGCWINRDARYLWQPGFWMNGQPGWVWCPDHYSYTPAGCVFVSGYWDHDLADRGLLFAPVCFNSPVWQNPGYSYTPNYCVDVPNLLGSLFLGPGNCGYYYGDYCGAGYADRGFQPWCLYGDRNYDPLFAYNRWEHRDDPGWYRGLRDQYYGRLNGNLPRLPDSLAQQRELLRNGRFGNAGLRTVTPLNRFHNGNLRLARVGRNQLLAQRRAEAGFRAVSRQRQALERPGAFRGGRAGALSLAHLPGAPGHAALNGRAGRTGPVTRTGPGRGGRAAVAGFGPGQRRIPSALGRPGPAAQPGFRSGAPAYRAARPAFGQSPAFRGNAGPFARGVGRQRLASPRVRAGAPANRAGPRAVGQAPRFRGGSTPFARGSAGRNPRGIASPAFRRQAPARTFRAPARSFARPASHPPAFHAGGGRRAPAFHGGGGGHRAPAFHGGGGGRRGGGGGGHGHGGGHHR
jgi:hypothetical protein